MMCNNDKMKNITNVLMNICLTEHQHANIHKRDSCHSPSHHTPAEKAPLVQYMLVSLLLTLALNAVLMTVKN